MPPSWGHECLPPGGNALSLLGASASPSLGASAPPPDNAVLTLREARRHSRRRMECLCLVSPYGVPLPCLYSVRTASPQPCFPLREARRGGVTAAQAGLANRASQAERKRVQSGIFRVRTCKHAPHRTHHTAPHTRRTQAPHHTRAAPHTRRTQAPHHTRASSPNTWHPQNTLPEIFKPLGGAAFRSQQMGKLHPYRIAGADAPTVEMRP